MVAESLGVARTESELLPLCDTTLDGTTTDGIARAARQMGLSATITEGEPAVLQESLSRQQPVIVFLGIPSRTPSNLNIHAVVVTGLDHHRVTFIDPLDGLEHEQQSSDFLGHWENAFHTAILLSRF
jgi:ABC-type bacteriocin/lantibiotic exporter with double-glycine peptidase domain